ncbi:cytidine deaminase [Dysgonomonas macrotermitis]|uniref:Cytidine deaminase n=1 Tax=Dysgonomonas macrotermitis TaxID=1346286 RepID=A0A1M5H0E5_9BACT|nr:cytidine deaminase [Dysgonomonas macrotermitis]SHG09346.1 cytidine deaminase [Dysgonomonas macrotermitis]
MESLEISAKLRVYSIVEYTNDKKILIEKAKNATNSAYAPYSGYNVGAAVLLADGTIVTGSNQENAAYPSGLCAERTALFYANAQYPDIPVKAIAIAASTKGAFTQDVCTPCGSCRQVLVEVENRFEQPVEIIMYGEKHIYEADSIRSLLPLCFGKDNLEDNVK